MRRQGRITGYHNWGEHAGHVRKRVDISHLWHPCSDQDHAFAFSDYTLGDAKQSFDQGLWAVQGNDIRALCSVYEIDGKLSQSTSLLSKNDDLLIHETFWLPFLEGSGFILKSDCDAGTVVIDDFPYGQIDEFDMPLLFYSGNENWGHWIIDVLGSLLALEHFPELADRKILFSLLTPVQMECLDLIGISKDRVMFLPAPSITTSSILLRDATITSPPPGSLIYPWLSEKMRQGAGGPSPSAAERIFLSRRRYYPSHRICNQDEVERLFEDRGFQILTPETMSVTDYVRAVSRARMIAGASGGALGNFLLAPTNCLQIHLMPDEFRNNFSGSSVLNRKFFGKYYYPLLDRLTMIFGDTANPLSQAFAKEGGNGVLGLDLPPVFDLKALDHAIMMAEKRLAIDDRLSW